MSSWTRASSAAISMVTDPMVPTKARACPEASNTENIRPTRYTPAATMVAAWIRAETGVGPAIASGSHTWRGNWADLPMAPPNRRRAATVSVPVAMW